MWKNYLIIAWRNLIATPIYSVLNILTLALGLCCAILMLTYLNFLTSFDSQFSDSERLAVLATETSRNGKLSPLDYIVTSDNLARIQHNLSGIEAITTTRNIAITVYTDHDVNEFTYFVDSAFFDIFDFPLSEGVHEHALSKPNSAVITQKIAKKYFGDEPAIGKTLSTNKGIVTITGVLEKIPDNTHFKSSKEIQAEIFLRSDTAPNSFPAAIYLKLKPDHSINLLKRDLATLLPPEQKLLDIPAMPHLGQEARTIDQVKRVLAEPLVGLNAVNISNRYTSFQGRGGEILYTMVAFAVLVLIISCVNYINLSTSRSVLRHQEIAIRKTLGASSRWVFQQFMVETLIVTAIAVLAGIGLSKMMLPWLCSSIGESPVSVGQFSPQLLGNIILLTLIAATAAGIYPALVVSRQQPAQALAGARSKQSRATLRNILITAQFTASIVLISTTLTLFLQSEAWSRMDTGVNRDNTAQLPLSSSDDLQTRVDHLCRELEGYPSIISSAPSMTLITPPLDYQLETQGNRVVKLTTTEAGYSTLEHFQIKLLAGRNFSTDFAGDKSIFRHAFSPPEKGGAVLLTSSGMKRLQITDPSKALGLRFNSVSDGGFVTFTVIGVVEGFPEISQQSGLDQANFLHLGNTMNMGFVGERDFSFKIADGQYPEAKQLIAQKLAEFKLDSSVPIQYTRHYENAYAKSIKQQLAPLLFFSVIALIISIAGIYSISSYTMLRRAREVALRKVMGATRRRVVGLLLWRFSRPVLTAIVLAIPATWFCVNHQLSNFNSLIPWYWIAFVITPLLALLIAWLTVSVHTLQVANSDPARALRCK